jgi:hypothetical protein
VVFCGWTTSLHGVTPPEDHNLNPLGRENLKSRIHFPQWFTNSCWSVHKRLSIKAKLSMCLTSFCTVKTYPVLNYHHVMKAHWVSGGVVLHAFLTSVTNGGEWSASRPGRFISGERAAGTYWIGGWVGLRAGLKIPAPVGNRTSVVQHVVQSLYWLSYPSSLGIISISIDKDSDLFARCKFKVPNRSHSLSVNRNYMFHM